MTITDNRQGPDGSAPPGPRWHLHGAITVSHIYTPYSSHQTAQHGGALTSTNTPKPAHNRRSQHKTTINRRHARHAALTRQNALAVAVR